MEKHRIRFGYEFYGDGLSSTLDIDDVTRLQFVGGMELGKLKGIILRTQQEKLKAFLSRRVEAEPQPLHGSAGQKRPC